MMAGALMKNRICNLAALFLLIPCLLLPLLPSRAAAETRVTITIAAGGVVGGLFFFLQFGFRSSLLQQYQFDSTGLLNRGPEGWEISCPSINIARDEGSKMAYPDRSGESVQMDIVKLRF
jgi:hypothetical protein